MKCTLIGFKTVDFTNTDGNRVEGINLFLAYPDSNVVGQVAEKKFVSSEIFDNFGVTADELENSVGCVINAEYGPKSKLVGLSLL